MRPEAITAAVVFTLIHHSPAHTLLAHKLGQAIHQALGVARVGLHLDLHSHRRGAGTQTFVHIFGGSQQCMVQCRF